MSRAFGHSPLDWRSMSLALRFLLLSSLIGFAMSWVVGRQMYDLFGLVPAHFWGDRWVWQAVTYLFLHGSFLHLLINVFCLWMFALPIESQWGSREFLKFYFLCGIGAGLIGAAIQPDSGVPIIGASGAIYGLLVAFAMLYPDAVVYLYFFFPLKARDMAILVGLVEFFAGASSTSPGIARFTHLSGMLIGYLYIRWWWILQIRIQALWRDAAHRRGLAHGRSEPGGPRIYAPRARPPSMAPMSEVDRILDKISAHGRDSLSPEEMEILRRVSKTEGPKEGHA